MAWIGGIWTITKLLIKYGPEAIELLKSAWSLVQSIQDKIEKGKRDDKIDKAGETKNPDDLEKSYRSGGGGS